MSIESCIHDGENEIFILSAYGLRRFRDGSFSSPSGGFLGILLMVRPGDISGGRPDPGNSRVCVRGVPAGGGAVPGDKKDL